MRQIIPPLVGTYLETLHGPVDALLDTIRTEGLAAGLPLVEPDTARLLRSLVIATRASRVLEVGTAIGYSAIWMAQALPAGGQLISLEIDPARAATARANINRAGLGATVSVIVGDAARFVHKVAGPFDLVFQDGSKELYEPLLDRLVELVRPGGVIVTDNVLWDGEVVDGFTSSPRHPETSTVAIRGYNTRLAGDSRLLTTFLACGDGVALSVKLQGDGGPMEGLSR